MGLTRNFPRPRKKSRYGGFVSGDDPYILHRALERHLNRPDWILLSKRVLVVEDNALNLKLYRDLLELLGHAVIAASPDDDVVSLVRVRRPDLIVVDLGGDAGARLALCNFVRRTAGFDQIPIIALADPAVVEDGRLSAGDVDGVLTKPVSPGAFLDALEASFADIWPPI